MDRRDYLKRRFMKTKKRRIAAFILVMGVMSVAFQLVHNILTGFRENSIVMDSLFDFPFVLLMAIVSLLIVHNTNKYFKYKANIYIRILFELFWATLFAAIYSLSISYLIGVIIFNDPTPEYLKSATTVILGNNFCVLLFELFFYNQRQLESGKHIAVIEKEKIEYLYATLKTQINPHFLFNSLNVLSSLIYEDPDRANVYTKKLSNIYRYFLSSNMQQRVSVKEEMAFLESYIYLLSIRFEEALVITINKETGTQEQIIPVSIQLLIENAIKHNTASVESPLTVTIDIMPAYIEVSNNLQPRMNVEESGHGLINLQKQYALYNKRIAVSKTKDRFIVRIPYL